MNTKININAIPETIPRSTSFKTINGANIIGNGDIATVEPRILEFTGGQLTADQLNYNIETYNKIINHEKIIVYEPALEGRPMYPLYIKSFDNLTSIITLVNSVNDLSYTYYMLNSTGDVQIGMFSEQYTETVTGVKINGETKDPSDGIVDLGYVSKQLSTSTESSMTLSPNIYYRNTSTTLSTLTITLGSVSNSDIINEYFVEFTTSSSGTTVSFPSNIKWANGEAPTFEASTTYQISIVNDLGVVTKFK